MMNMNMNMKILNGELEMSDKSRKSGGLRSSHRFAAICAASAICAMVPAAAFAAGGGAPAGPSTAVKFEPVPGTNLKRVILTKRAAQRLGIEINKISEKPITLTQMYGGQVTNSQRMQQNLQAGTNTGGVTVVASKNVKPVIPTAMTLTAGNTLISLVVSASEWERINKSASARVTPLATRSKPARPLVANLVKLAPVFDPRRNMLTVYYGVSGKDHGLTLNDRMRVELTQKGSGRTAKVAPFSSIYYDGKGLPWVYVQTKPLTYERKRVVVDRYVGNDAVLKDGPSLGTEVVSVGASLLFGAEVIYKR
jgi:hypothetical protein